MTSIPQTLRSGPLYPVYLSVSSLPFPLSQPGMARGALGLAPKDLSSSHIAPACAFPGPWEGTNRTLWWAGEVR